MNEWKVDSGGLRVLKIQSVLSSSLLKAIIYQVLSRLMQKSPRAGEKLGVMVGFALRWCKSTAAHPVTPLMSMGMEQTISWAGEMKPTECKQKHLQLCLCRQRGDRSVAVS